MLITLSSLAGETTLYSIQLSFLLLSFLLLKVHLHQAVLCAHYHAMIISKNSFGLKPWQVCVIYFFDVCNL